MIDILLHNTFNVYICIWLAVLTVLWIREEIRTSRSSVWSAAKEKLYSCDKCHLVFLAKDEEHITRCPRCNELCFIKKRKRF